MSPNLPDRLDASRVVMMRQQARAIFDHALAECSISKAFARCINFSNGQLEVAGHRYNLTDFSRVAVVSIGKAGHSLAEALSKVVTADLGGIIACPDAPKDPLAGFRYFYGGHPLPNEDSLRAGTAILGFLQALPQRSLVVFLISGGASAIAEKPISADLTLSDVIETNRALVLSGAPIAEINAIRKHLSAIKGGRMAKAAAPATQVSLLVSDVPDHAIDALASGPTMPDTSTIADCYAIVRRYDLLGKLPKRTRLIFESGELLETPKQGDDAFTNSRYVIVLSNQTALDGAATHAKILAYAVEVDVSSDDWDYARAADHLLARLRSLRQNLSPVCLISGGEVTVTVTNKSGVGGRNQQFALYCAEKIAGESITVLSAGTDGIDGNSPAAGAVVDGTTVARARERGLDVGSAISRFDASPLLAEIGDAIVTGPTGNNVRDLRILLAY
jgi:hydroxypyruvate reductase